MTDGIPSSNAITRRAAIERAALLLGGAISAPTLLAALAGCERRSREATASVLTREQRELVGAIAEHIIPETDTPGARAVGVPDFIDMMMAEYYPAEERDHFLRGLAKIDERARREHQRDFLACSAEEQAALLLGLDREAFAPRPPQPEEQVPDTRARTVPGGGETPLPPEVRTDTIQWVRGEPRPAASRPEVPFFRTMKELTLIGYYTSQPGATVELRHEAVPGRYDGCVPFDRIGRTWSVSG